MSKKGGGSKKPAPTALEKQNARIAMEKWNNFVENGIPAQNEAIKMMTTDLLDSGGNVKLDEGSAIASTEKLYQDQVHNPNNPILTSNIESEKMNTSALAGIDQKNNQVSRYHDGLTNALKIGKGQELEALKSKSDITQQANNEVLTRYQADRQNRIDNTGALFAGAGALTRGFGGNILNKNIK